MPAKILAALTAVAFFTACENPVKKAARNAGYAAYEMVGVQKRDLLKKRINETRDEQKEAGEQFADSLEKLQKMYGLKGGKLESQYKRVKSSFDDSKEKVAEVKNARRKMETVADDLFREWEGEIDDIQTPEFKNKSRAKLQQTRSRFNELNRDLTASEAKMDPVLTRLNDHVLYLKHNLNAQSIAQLKTENARIENDIQNLIKDMNRSIGQADAFIKTIE
jgi:hypothetical protein